MEEHPSFRQWLREHRKDYGYTQGELAQRVGCSVITIRRIEEGVLRPSRQLAELIAAGLEVPPGERAQLVLWARADPLKPRPASALPDSAVARAPTSVAVLTPHDGRPEGAGGAQVRNPYKGLRPFAEADAPDFFGREALTARLTTRLAEDQPWSRFLALVGPSGCGKSSVVHAGLVPAVRRAGLPGGRHPVVLSVTPGAHPLEEIEAALLRIAPNPPASLLEQLAADERGLVRAVKRTLPPDRTGLLLIVDQFEELFAPGRDPALRLLVLNSLHAAVAEPNLPLWIVITLRADFFDGPLTYGASLELMRSRTEMVGALTADELHRAIAAPAAGVGVALDDALVATLEREMAESPGALPLLEYTLTELFEQRREAVIPLEAYHAAGGLQGVLDRRADAIYAGLTPVEQREAQQLFLRLITLHDDAEDTRRRTLRSELASAAHDEEALDRVLEAFGQARLLTFDRDLLTHGPTVELAHESLIRHWGRLHTWLEESRVALHRQRRLAAAATEWEHAGHDPAYLATGARLAEFEAPTGGGDGIALTAEERAYLQASVQERDHQAVAERARHAQELALEQRVANHLRIIVAGLAGFVLIATLLAGFAFAQRGEAQAQRRQAQQSMALALSSAATAMANQHEADAQREAADTSLQRSEAQRLAAEASTLLASWTGMRYGHPAELIGLLAARSLGTAYTPQGDLALAGALSLAYPIHEFSGHTGWIYGIAFSPDGRYLATASADGTARLWDVASGQELRQLAAGGGDELRRLAFSPDGQYLLTGGKDEVARLWAVPSGTLVRTFVGHTAQINSVAFSPDGLRIATSASTSDPTVRIWDARTGVEIAHLMGHSAAVGRVAFSHDGARLLSGSFDGTVRVWDSHTGQPIRTIAVPGILVYDAAWSADDRYIVGACDDNVARMWDAATGEEVRRFAGHHEFVFTLAVSPDGRYLLTGSGDNTTRLWDLQAGTLLRTFVGHSSSVAAVAFSPDSQFVATGSADNLSFLWPAQGAGSISRPAADLEIAQPAFYTSGGRLMLEGTANGRLQVVDAETGGRRLTCTAPLTVATGGPPLWRVSDDLRYCVAYPNGAVPTEAVIMDAAGDQVVATFPMSGRYGSVAFSPDGTRLLAVDNGLRGYVYELPSGRRLAEFDVGTVQYYSAAAFSPYGQYLLTSSGDDVQLRNARDGTLVQTFRGHTDLVYLATFSSDGRYIASGGSDATVRLWDVATGAEVRRFTGHTSYLLTVKFSPDGRRLLTSSLADESTRVWDVATGQELRRLTGYTEPIRDAFFSRDGATITLVQDTVVRQEPASYKDAVRLLCSRLIRDFTPDERAAYEIKGTDPTCPAQ